MGIVAGFMVPHPPMIVPEIGRGSEKQIEATKKAYENVADMICELAPDTIIISSPHSVMYGDYFHISPGKYADGSFRRFDAGEVSFHIEYDRELVNAIIRQAIDADIAAGKLGEKEASLDHGTMVPLYFITQKYTDFKLVRIGLSGFSLATHYELGQAIKKAATELDRRVVYIASGDLSHKLKEYGPYGFVEEGPVYDERIMDVMGRGDFDELLSFNESFLDTAAECGHRSFVMMAGALDRTNLSITRMSHEDVTGVGYGICSYIVDNEEPNEDRAFLDKRTEKEAKRLEEKRASEDLFVRLARASTEYYVNNKSKLNYASAISQILKSGDEALLSELEGRQAGAFVSLHIGDSLRGCIGTIAATQSCIAEEIICNAISACSLDNRFEPVTPDELNYIEYSVDILGEREKISSADELDVKRYGVIVSKGMRRGLLLPNLDNVKTVDEQIAIAKRKGGISVTETDIQLERFEVVRHF
ncbi:MAG: AmmeMemoRadiSam system protein A [Lachnospiraceae bacterium]|nr:AmmeMemoRadiSam system protein A [Lachnospiraceae bacterium]